MILTPKDLKEIKRSISKIKRIRSIDWVGNDYDIYSSLHTLEGWDKECSKYVALAAVIAPDLIETLEQMWSRQQPDGITED